MSLSLAPLDWMVMLLTMAGSLFLGLYIAYRTRAGENSTNYFLAGRQMTWPIVGASMYATNIGAEHLVGLSGDSYRYGLCAGTIELTCALCLGFACAVLYPYYMKNNVFTIPEFLEIRYDRRARAFFSGLMLVICIMTKMAFTLFAGALVINGLLGWDIMITVVVLGIAVSLFTIFGGFVAVAYTDSLQTVIMLLGCSLMLIIGLYKVGGWHQLVTAAPIHIRIAKPYNDPNFPFWGVIAGAIYGGTFYWGIDQVNVQRVLGSKNINHARWGAMFTTLLKLTPVFIFALPGVIAYVLYPDLSEPKQTFVLLLNKLLPSGLRGLVFAALLAALWSSLVSVMNSSSTLVVRDFVLHLRPNMPEKKQVLIGRLAVLLIMFLGVAAAYLVYASPDGIYKYLQAISIYLVMPITPAIVFGIMSKRITLMGAFVSVLLGALIGSIFVIDQLVGVETGTRFFPWLHTDLTANYTYRGLWGTLIIIGTLFIVSGFTEKTSPEKLEKTTIDWSSKFESFQGWSDWRLMWAGLTVITVVVYAWLW